MRKIVLFVMILCVQGLFSQDSGLSFLTSDSGFNELFRIPEFGRPILSQMAVNSDTAGSDVPAKTIPLWLKDLRRAEIVAFGSVPLTIFWTAFFFDVYRCATHGWDGRYAPWPFKAAGAVSLTEDERNTMFGIALSASLSIAIADQIIIHLKRSKARKNQSVIETIIKTEL